MSFVLKTKTRFAYLLFLCVYFQGLAAQGFNIDQLFMLASSNNIQASKLEVLVKANKHKMEGISELYKAQDMCWYIPDLDDRTHLQALITAAITSGYVADPRSKLLAVGLSVIASLSNKMYDKYCTFRLHLITASYHFEMCNFYDTLSLQLPAAPHAYDDGTRSFFNAIDSITLCSMLVDGISDHRARINMSKLLIEYREYLLNIGISGKIEKMSKNGWRLFDRMQDNLNDIEDEEEENLDLTIKIITHLRAMISDLELTEKLWGIKSLYWNY
ncbi:MAG: hypothetical protein CK425_03425 [Parachlamydia sp.]|nr:MAG: hypothetical protein CK425_03425 [Parachlamydia sp.]